ncbi:MAG TPA: hypothetical protein VHF90_08790, partial [Thermoleophilaceae bacterium]|nr:hypothetical protein [Thermoleophilaceae bacterium]
VDLSVPQNDDPPGALAANPADVGGAPGHWRSDAGLATSQLEGATVTLPEGVSLNPSAATGLQACSDAQIGVTDASSNPMLFNDDDPFDGQGSECPDGSRIGLVTVETPLLDDPLTGEVVLGEPKSTDPQSGQMFRLFIVVRSPQRGLVAKIFGSSVADPATGRLTTTFQRSPRVPFEDMRLSFKKGPRGLLAMPQQCSPTAAISMLRPWSQAHLPESQRSPAVISQQWAVDQACAFGFAPSLHAGVDRPGARQNGMFTFQLTRPQGDRWVEGLTATLPKGLLASVRGVPLCPNAQANTGACPAGSRIGSVDASAGSGDPFVLEQKGEVFLTEGYKGAPYGLAVRVPVVAGPFRDQMALSPIVVRQQIQVDRASARVTAVSDPLPTVHHGVPLRMRSVTVLIDRPAFMLNPSDCSAHQVAADIAGQGGASAQRSVRFQAANCHTLRFKPRLALRLTGRRQMRTGKHPGVRATVRQTGVSEAGIEKAVVRLPKTLALDVNNAQALCEFADGTRPDPENHCPKASIVGRARAVSPLLNRPLVGNVYFVKNVRIDPDSGKPRRTLPMIVVALRGEIAVNLKGESSTTKTGKLVNTFDEVPDAPISRFDLSIKGGSKGILAVTRTRRAKIDICTAGRQIAETDINGQNGKRHDRNIRIKTPCRKAKRKAANKRSPKNSKRHASRRRR